MTWDSARQQTPYRCQRRNQGLCASISSCLRWAEEMSLALNGLMSGASKISWSCSISSMMRSTSMGLHHLVERGNRSNQSCLCFSESVSSLLSQRTSAPELTPAALADGHRGRRQGPSDQYPPSGAFLDVFCPCPHGTLWGSRLCGLRLVVLGRMESPSAGSAVAVANCWTT